VQAASLPSDTEEKEEDKDQREHVAPIDDMGLIDETLIPATSSGTSVSREQELAVSILREAITLTKLGDVRRREGDDDTAIEHYTKAKTIIIDNLGNDHDLLIIICRNLGTTYQHRDNRGDCKKAIDEYKQSLDILKSKISDEDSPPIIGNFLSWRT
jgi:tetratricopeptide (TPR) repeat protein